MGTDTSSAAEDVLLRRPERDWADGILGLVALFALLAGGFCLIGGIAHGDVALLIFGPLFLVISFGTAIVLLPTRRPIRLTSAALTIPWGRRLVVIPVPEIAGIGLVFRAGHVGRAGPPPGWYLRVWRQDGTWQVTPFRWLPTRYKVGSGESVEVNSSADGFDPVVGTDLAALERTQAAVVARELQTRVAALQGPEGPLATMALQKHPAVDRRTGTPVLAWWSPGDGEIGYPDRRT